MEERITDNLTEWQFDSLWDALRRKGFTLSPRGNINLERISKYHPRSGRIFKGQPLPVAYWGINGFFGRRRGVRKGTHYINKTNMEYPYFRLIHERLAEICKPR